MPKKEDISIGMPDICPQQLW